MSLRKRGDKWYFDIIDATGRRVVRSTGQKDRKLAERIEHDAHEEVIEEKRKLRLGIRGAAPKRIDLAVAEFLAIQQGQWSEKYWAENAKWYKTLLLPGVGGSDVLVSAVSREVAKRLRDRLSTEVGRVMLNRVLAAFSTFFTWAVESGYAVYNPWVGQKRNKESKRQPPMLSEAQLDKYLLAYSDLRIRRAATVALDTGLRASEVRRIRRGDWEDAEEPMLLVRSGYTRGERDTTKNGEARMVPLTPRALNALRVEFDASGDDMFATLPEYREAKAKAIADAGLPHFTWHDQRHYALTRFADMGVTPHDLKAVAGWKTGAMADRYIHGSARRVAAMMAKTVTNSGCNAVVAQPDGKPANAGEERDSEQAPTLQ